MSWHLVPPSSGSGYKPATRGSNSGAVMDPRVKPEGGKDWQGNLRPAELDTRVEHAAVDEDRLAGDVAGLRRAQEGGQFTELFR
jgi:hypothetical protein